MNAIIEKAGNLIGLGLMIYVGLNIARYASGTGVVLPLLVVLLVLLLAMFLLAPVLIRQTFWITKEPNFQPFDPEDLESPPEVLLHFAEVSEELQQLGFSPELSCRTKGATPNADGFVSLFQNRKTLESARLITAIGNARTVRNVASFAVFDTEFSDGTEVVTSNRTSPKVFPARRPPYHGAAFPQVRRIADLLDVHRAMAGRFNDGRIRVDVVANDPNEYLRQKDHIQPIAHQIACGYAYVDEPAGVLRSTWKGAFLMTWKLMPPIKQIRLAWERLQAAKLLRQLDQGRWVG